MDCAEVRDDLSAFLDQELAPERRSAIGQHLRECAACASAAEALRGVIAAVALLPRVQVPPGLAGSIYAQLALAPSGPRVEWLARLRRPVQAFAAVAAVLAIVCLYPSGRTRDRKDELSSAPSSKAFALGELERRRGQDAATGEAAASIPGDRIVKEKEAFVAGIAGDEPAPAAPRESGLKLVRLEASSPEMERTLEGLEADLDALHASFAVESPAPAQRRLRVTVARAEAGRILDAMNSRRAELGKALVLRSRVEKFEDGQSLKDRADAGPAAAGAGRSGAAGGGAAKLQSEPGSERDYAERDPAMDKKSAASGFMGVMNGKDERSDADETVEIVIELVRQGD